ncbi:MAG: thioredoxin domain-containing protein [Vicinamibacteraceae bacterium]
MTRTTSLWMTIGGVAVLGGGFWLAGPGLATQSSSSAGVRAEQVDGKTRYTNRLIDEKSPYLQLHAHNPVDWYPWGDEAFAKARRENKPIFLSIGYSTCHWCHVMERESFSDPAIAKIMNAHFVSIKVDREERPDVDRIYMTFVQATTGGGGWPMSVFLTPDLKPFFGGTYFPPDDRYGRPGFKALLLRIQEAWAQEREKVLAASAKVTEALRAQVEAGAAQGARFDKAVLDQAYQAIKTGYDAEQGGFGSAPKFPRPVVFNFLLRYYARTDTKDAREMTLHTLRAMARGGMHDHLGGGFHRYSTDRVWHVPHFEKMLYDQSQLAISYTEAYQITEEPFFAETARDILDYVLRDMRGREGGFYSAEDADSLIEAGKAEHAEGAFYVWTADEIAEVIGRDAAAIFSSYYGVEPAGNVPAQQDIQGELKGKNVLIVRHTVSETAKKFGTSKDEVEQVLARARRKLVEVRTKRPRPPLDDKVLTAWNGLMISALARAGQVLEEPRYVAAARASAGFIASKMYDAKRGILQRRYREGEVAIDGFIDDYAFLVQGLLDLYEASFESKWLTWAVRLQETQDRLFWDAKEGSYFATQDDAAHLLWRMKEDYDGAEPSPNSVAAMNLLRLWQMTDREDWREKADATFAAHADRLRQQPAAVPQLIAALDFSLSKPKQIIIAGRAGAEDTRAMLRLVHDRFIPNKILLLADGGAGQRQLARWLPFVEGVSRKDGKATAYICEDYVCQLPTADLEVAARLLDGTWTPGAPEVQAAARQKRPNR